MEIFNNEQIHNILMRTSNRKNLEFDDVQTKNSYTEQESYLIFWLHNKNTL